MQRPFRPRGAFLLMGFAAAAIATGCGGTPAQREAHFVASAKSYLAAGHYNEAIIQFRNALQIDPRSADLHDQLADAYAKNQQYAQAFSELRKTLDLQPDDLTANLALGQLDLAAKRYDEALQASEVVLAKHPTEGGALVLEADAYAAKGDPAKAGEILGGLTQTQPSFVPGVLGLGLLDLSLHKTNLAAAAFHRAIAIDPKTEAAYQGLAGLDLMGGQTMAAEQELLAGVRADPASPNAEQALGHFYIGQHRYTNAERAFKAVVTLQHDSPTSQFALATFYLSQGRADQAKSIDAALALHAPDFIAARVQLAQIELAGHELKAADKALSALVRDDPIDPRAFLLRARLRLSEGDAPNAIKDLQAVQRLNPNIAEVDYLMGLAYRMTNNPDLAQDSFQQAISLNPKYLDAQLALAQLMMDRGQPQPALLDAQQALAADPASSSALDLQGHAELRLGRLPEAERSFQQLARLAPKSPLGPIGLGEFYFSTKQYSPARNQFLLALKRDPNAIQALTGLSAVDEVSGHTQVAINRVRDRIAQRETAPLDELLGQLYAQAHQSGAAEAAFERAIHLDPKDPNPHVLLATFYTRQKNAAKAQAEFAAATQADPQSATLWATLGVADEQAGQPQQAEQAYRQALTLDSNNGIAANNLAWIYCNKNVNMEQALDLAQRARRALPNDASVADTLGWIYVKQSLYATAIPLLQEAVRDNPNDGEFHFHLAAALFHADHKPEARIELAKALRLDGSLRGQPEARAILSGQR